MFGASYSLRAGGFVSFSVGRGGVTTIYLVLTSFYTILLPQQSRLSCMCGLCHYVVGILTFTIWFICLQPLSPETSLCGRLVLLRERKAVIKFEKQISEIAKCKWGCLVDKLENIFNKLFLTFSQEAETYLELVMDPCTWETIVVVTRVHKPITRSFSFVILHIYLF